MSQKNINQKLEESGFRPQSSKNKNEPCPFCNQRTVEKWGIIACINGKKQRFKCNNCGHTFYFEIVVNA